MPNEITPESEFAVPFEPVVRGTPKFVGRPLKLVALGLTLSLALGLAWGYESAREAENRANHPEVVVEVIGLHCPIQCGLKVASELEKIPGVLPKTVSANPKTGRVTFRVEDSNRVSRDEIERAILRAGFTVRSVEMPQIQK